MEAGARLYHTWRELFKSVQFTGCLVHGVSTGGAGSVALVSVCA